MSDPYNQYNQQQNYSTPPPGQGYYPPQDQHYPPQQQGYNQQSYDHNQQSYGHSQQPQYPPPQNQYPDAPEGGFGPPKRQDSYGPPAAGGFQHGQAGGQYGAYDASNPQGNAGYYGDTRSQDPSPYPPQQGGYQPPYDPNNPHAHQQPPYDPNNPHQQQSYGAPPPGSDFAPGGDPNAPEGERGLGATLVGGFGGRYIGKKVFGHGKLGAVGGAFLANAIENQFKDKKKHGSQYGGGSSHSGSSWGGKW